MFSSLTTSPLIALAAYGVAVSAAPSLVVKTWTPNSNADGLKNLKVTTTIVNTGGETLRLLNDPRGVLDPFPEDTFTITDSSGSHPSFRGAKTDYNPSQAVGFGSPGDFTILAPGDTINVTHDLSAAYDFTLSGAGDYYIKPQNLFTYADTDGALKNLSANVEGIAKVKLFGDLAAPRRVYDKRDVTFHQCGSERHHQTIMNAVWAAKEMANAAYNYLYYLDGPTTRYTTWFGKWDADRKLKVQDIIGRVAFYDVSKFHFDCVCDREEIELKTAAYVKGEIEGLMYICPAFWEGDLDVHSILLVHEITHYDEVGRTTDHGYPEDVCMGYATYDPEMAIENAKNYMYFVENLRPPLP